jgi:hypothetical protein
LCPKDKYNRGIITRTPMKKKIAWTSYKAVPEPNESYLL